MPELKPKTRTTWWPGWPDEIDPHEDKIDLDIRYLLDKKNNGENISQSELEALYEILHSKPRTKVIEEEPEIDEDFSI